MDALTFADLPRVGEMWLWVDDGTLVEVRRVTVAPYLLYSEIVFGMPGCVDVTCGVDQFLLGYKKR